MGGKKKYINIFGSFTEPFNYSYFVDVLVSDRDQNVNEVRIIGCVLMNFSYETFAN